MLFRLTLALGLSILATIACAGSSTDSADTGERGPTSGRGATDAGGAGAGSQGGTSGSGGSSGKGGGGGGLAMSEAPVAVARAACSKIYECCSEQELMNIAIVGGSESACQAVVAAYITLQLQSGTAAFDAGRLGYDGTALDGMIEELSSRSCDMLPALEELDLSDVLVPMVDAGDECGLDYECIDGYCDGGGDAANPHGTCMPQHADGDACSTAAQCAGGYCDGTACGVSSGAPLCAGS